MALRIPARACESGIGRHGWDLFVVVRTRRDPRFERRRADLLRQEIIS